jgi:hypothetical protein
MNLDKIKNLFLKSLIGCLIAAALLAVATVLTGQFNDIFAKALFTILLIALHCLVSFGFIVNNERQETFDNLEIFTNATFVIIVLSFITSIFGVWGVLDGSLVAKLYAFYFVLLFATLHGEILAKTEGKQSNIDTVVHSNYFFMLVVVLMILPIIFLSDNSSLGPFYYRVLAACGIIDATLTLIAVILHKLYIQKHPTIKDPVFSVPLAPGQPPVQLASATVPVSQPKKRMNIFVIILIGYVVLQLGGGLILLVIGALHK